MSRPLDPVFLHSLLQLEAANTAIQLYKASVAAARAPRVSGRVQDMRTLHENVDSATYELEYTYAKERQTRPCGRPTTTTSIGMHACGWVDATRARHCWSAT